MSNQAKYVEYRRRYPTFVYSGYEWRPETDGLHLSFEFRVGDDIVFRPTAFVPSRPFLSIKHLDKETLDVLVFNIGMAELVSYWKCFCPPRVEVSCGSLTGGQIAFWKKLYYHGLGEFFYLNGIEATQDDFMAIDALQLALDSRPMQQLHLNKNNYLVPIGGGKDSVVTLEALRTMRKGATEGIRPLIMNPRGATVGCAERGGYDVAHTLYIYRTLCPVMLEQNRRGCLNGHTPFSAMLAFYTLLALAMSGDANVALSNESSANESTVLGSSVNHQYSKSFEFEEDFRRYVAEYISPEVRYFSFLRPLTELQIASLFARLDQYHDVFRSCNVGSKTDEWCGHCAKCLFAYIILSPFLQPTKLQRMFGKDMLNESACRREFDQLTGRLPVKPFECVGTVSEVNAALCMALNRYYCAQPLPVLLRDYQAVDLSTDVEKLLHSLGEESNLNEAERSCLQHILQDGEWAD